MIQELAQKKMILVTGKGGTGKTSLSVALGLLAAKKKRKVLLAEVDMTRPSMEDIFGKSLKVSPSRLYEGIDGINVEFFESLHQYLGETISVDLIVNSILKNKVVRYFLESTPFAREIAILNTLYTWYQRPVSQGGYDLIIVDMPATGHARSILSVPRSIFRMFSFGPLLKRAREIDAFLNDHRRVCLSLVSLAEEMPVNETIEAWGKLSEATSVTFGPLFVNRLPREDFSPEEELRLMTLRGSLVGETPARINAVLGAGEEACAMSRRARSGVERLSQALPIPLVLLKELDAQNREPAPFKLARLLEEMS